MADAISSAVFLIAAFLAASFGILSVIGTLQITKNREIGYLYIIPYGIMFTALLIIAFGGRDFSSLSVIVSAPKSGAVTWIQRLFSMAMLLVALERIATAFIKPNASKLNAALLWSFIAFWLCSTLSPVLFAQHSVFEHDCLYPLIFGVAALLATVIETNRIILATRNAIFSFTALSWAMVAVSPGLVLESNYSQGFLPGVPRFAGLAAHAVVLGTLVQTGIYCVWAQPYKNKYINRVAWVVLLAALVLSQSKTAWLSFVVCSVIMIKVRFGEKFNGVFFSSRKPFAGISLLSLGALIVVSVVFLILTKDPGSTASTFLATKEGAQLASLTGRDQIWAAALSEWRQHPIFGYGTELFSAGHRASWGLLSAIHAHNQFIDTLARAGIIGAFALIVYLIFLGWYSFKYARMTSGLSAALFTAIFLRSIAEIPLSLSGYGHEFLGHFVLLALLASAQRQSRSSSTPKIKNNSKFHSGGATATPIAADS